MMMNSDVSSDDGNVNGIPDNVSISSMSPSSTVTSSQTNMISRKHKLQLRINSKDLEYDSEAGSVRSKDNNVNKVEDEDERSTSSGGFSFLKKLTVKGALSLGNLNLAHLPHLNEKSFTDLKNKIFHGKGIKKLKNISKRRKQRRRSANYAGRKRVGKIMNSKWALVVMLVATFYLLFIDDMMLATGAPDSHVSFTVISVLKIVVFLVFVADIFCSIYVQRLYYVLSFYLPIDLISIASLIPDIISFIFGISSITHAINSLSLSRTARVARIASRLSRISKIINFFNILQCSKRVEAKDNHQLQLSMEPSSIGKQLLGKTSHKVMIMALLLVLITVLTNPQQDLEAYSDSVLNLFISSANANGVNSTEFQQTFQEFKDNSDNVDILYLEVNGNEVYKSSIDTSDWFVSYIKKTSIGDSEIWLNNKRNEQVLAALGITLTVCLIIILLFGIFLLSRDFQNLVIKPIERMVSLIKKISSMDRGGDSDYESDYDNTEDYLDGDTEGVNMSDLSDVEGQYSQSDTESYGGYNDEPETNIIVELLSDIATKKIEMVKKEKTIIEVQSQIRSGFEALVPVSKAFLQRKLYISEKKKYDHRNRAIGELLKSEEQYVQFLDIAIDHYLIPLRQGDKSDILKTEQVQGIFANIEVLCEFQRTFLGILSNKIKTWSINDTIGEVMIYIVDGSADVYCQYVNNYNNAIKLIVDETKANEDLQHFLNEVREKHSDLMSCLITPIQRIPRYVMLMEDVLKHTPMEHHDRDAIDRSVKALKKLANLINERKRDSENKSQIQDIYMKLVPPEPDILSPGNCLLINTKLKQDSEKYQFFLFQHGLLKTIEHENELEVKGYYPIKDTTQFALTIIQDCPSMKIINAFQLKVDSELLLLFAKTPEIRNTWLNAFTQCTKIQHQRTKSMLYLNNSRKSTRGSGIIGQPSPNMSQSRLSISSTKPPNSLLNASTYSTSSSNLSSKLSPSMNSSNNNNNNNNS